MRESLSASYFFLLFQKVAEPYDECLVVFILLQGGILEPNMLLLILTALGIELGIVAWLGTRHDMQLAQD